MFLIFNTANAESDKYEGNCPGQEVEGRCVDRPFDPANCQYPDRWTNPVGGCDNSDPAVPECIKSFSTQQGEKDCIDAFVKAHEPAEIEQPTEPVIIYGK